MAMLMIFRCFSSKLEKGLGSYDFFSFYYSEEPSETLGSFYTTLGSFLKLKANDSLIPIIVFKLSLQLNILFELNSKYLFNQTHCYIVKTDSTN